MSRAFDRPGCGVSLPPDPAAPPTVSYNASAECWQVYGEVVWYGNQHALQLGRWRPRGS